MPAEKDRMAAQKSDMPFQRLSKEEISACPLVRWQGPIRLIRTPEEMTEAVQVLELENLLGFDTETRPSFRKGESYPPALLQLAGAREVFIFQLPRLGLPEPLRSILAAPGIVKAGVAPSHDLRELRKLAPFEPAGFVDLSRLAKQTGIKNHGLRGLTAVLLGCRIAKGARTSNWARDDLSAKQLDYAATDAWLGRELYLKLVQLRRGDSSPAE